MKQTIKDLVVGEVLRWERLFFFFITLPYVLWIASTGLPAWLKLVLIIANPLTLRTAVVMWYRREVLELAYWLYYAHFQTRRLEKVERDEKIDSD